MNNELLLEWCILNNPGVKQDVFPNDSSLSDKFTTAEDDATYGSLTSIGNQSIHRSSVIDKFYKTNLKPSTIQQFPQQKKRGRPRAGETKVEVDKTASNMKKNDLGKGSDWVNPRFTNLFFKILFKDNDEVTAKKLLKYAWLQGKLDNANMNTDIDRKISKSYNISKYIKDLDVNTLNKNTGKHYDQEYQKVIDAFKNKYIDAETGTQKFTLNQTDETGKLSDSNKILLTVNELEIIASYPLWIKEFNNAYERIKKYLDKFNTSETIKLYRGLYLTPDTNILYNYKTISSPDTLYKLLQNQYNSATTDIARALYFAMDPKTKVLNQNSLIFELIVKKELLNIPYTMYLNGKNGKYGECELNLLKDDKKNNSISSVQAYIGPKSINTAIINSVEDSIGQVIKPARSNSTPTKMYYINFENRTIKFIDHDRSSKDITYTIVAHAECNLKNDANKKHYYTFIIAKKNDIKEATVKNYVGNQYFFLYDRFTNTIAPCSCKVKEELNINDIADAIYLTTKKSDKSTKSDDSDKDEDEIYSIILISEDNGELKETEIATCSIFKDFSRTRKYMSDDYEVSIKNSITDMIKSLVYDEKYTSDKNILNNFKKTIVNIYNFDKNELDEIVDQIKDKKDNEELTTLYKTQQTDKINEFKAIFKSNIAKYGKYINLKSINNEINNINPDNYGKLDNIINNIINTVKSTLINNPAEIKEQNKIKNETKEDFLSRIEKAREVLKTNIFRNIKDIYPKVDTALFDNLAFNTTINNISVRKILAALVANVTIDTTLNDNNNVYKAYSTYLTTLINKIKARTTNIDTEIEKLQNNVRSSTIFSPKKIDNTLTVDSFEQDIHDNIIVKKDELFEYMETSNADLNQLPKYTESTIVFNKSKSKLVESFYQFLRSI